MSETVVVKGIICVLVLWLVGFPSGVLYSRGKLTRNWVALLAGVGGAGVGVIVSAPDFEPLGPTVLAIVWGTIVWALGVRISLALFGKFVRLPR